jgi:hypothetical protein
MNFLCVCVWLTKLNKKVACIVVVKVLNEVVTKIVSHVKGVSE